MPDQPRIAVVCLHTSPDAEPGSGDAGGMNVVVRHHAAELARRGCRVDVFTRRDDPDAPDEVDLGFGARLRRITAGPPAPVGKGEHERFVAQFAASLGDLREYDLVHSHHWFSGMAALPAARAAGIPHVQTFHSIAADPTSPMSHGERPESPGRLAGERGLAQDSDLVVAISRAEARTAADRLGAPPGRITVVPPGVDAAVFHPDDGQAHERDGHGYVLLAARLDPLKGVDLAVAALAMLPPQRRPRLVVVGDASAANAPYVQGVGELAERRGVAGDVRFLGPRSRAELARLMRESRVVLVPSYSETYGLVALEAAASGVPVVAAHAGGLVEAVVDGVTGVVLDTRDPARWAAALDRLLADDDTRRRLGRAARARAAAMTWEASAEALLTAYRCLLHAPVVAGERQWC